MTAGAEKEYEVVTDKPMTQETMAKLIKGMITEEGHDKVERAWLTTGYRANLVLSPASASAGCNCAA
jgi:hypothetical protein